MTKKKSIQDINKKIVVCKKCPRLYEYVRQIAKNKTKRFMNQEYWGRPLPGFGDVGCQMLVVGLAPAAHGGTRTGRMFTGDSSADWLAKALYKNGFATKPTSETKDDGFKLIDAYVTAAARCAPPQNKPLREELKNCSVYLENELIILKNVKIIVCLGKIAFCAVSSILQIKGQKFSHGHVFTTNKYTIICSYHPSRQNTNTGRLIWKDWNAIFSKCKKLLKKQK